MQIPVERTFWFQSHELVRDGPLNLGAYELEFNGRQPLQVGSERVQCIPYVSATEYWVPRVFRCTCQ